MQDWWKTASKTEFVPYLNIMAHLEDKPDEDVFEKYGLRGFPTMLLLDHDGELLLARFVASNDGALRTALREVEPLFAARRAAAKPDATPLDRARLVLLEGLRKPAKADFDAMEKAAAMEGMDPKLIREFEKFRSRGPFAAIYETYRAQYGAAGEDPTAQRAARAIAMQKTYALLKKGQAISDAKDDLHRPFWILAFDGAVEAKDKPNAEKAYEAYVAAYAKSPRYKSFIPRMERKLQNL